MKTLAAWMVAVLLALPLAGPGPAQPPVAPPPRPAAGEASLFVVQDVNIPPSRVIDRQRIVRVGYKNGVMQPPEVRWEGSWDIYLDWSAKFVQNRYVVTRKMTVIDLAAGKDINPRSGELVAVDGDAVAYRVDHAYRDVPAGVYTFDLKTHAARRVGGLGEGKYGLPGKRSPDGLKSVANDDDEYRAGVPEPHAAPGELVLYRVGEPRRSLGKDFSVQTGVAASPFPSWLSLLPVLWLDDGRFLTQVKNGELVTVALDGTRTPVVTLPVDDRQRFYSPELVRDPGGRVIYSGYGGPAAVVDVKNRKWEERKWADLGHGFEMSDAAGQDGYPLRHNGREIGRVWCPPWHVKAADGYLAVETWRERSYLIGEQVLRVWSAATGTWSTLPKVPNVYPNHIIGWVK